MKNQHMYLWGICSAALGFCMLPLSIGMCAFVYLKFFPLIAGFAIPPLQVFGFVFSPLIFLLLGGQGALMGLLSVLLWRGDRGGWVRLFCGLVGTFIVGAWGGLTWSAFGSFTTVGRLELLRLYVVCVAPIVLWALGLLFFALLVRVRKQSPAVWSSVEREDVSLL